MDPENVSDHNVFAPGPKPFDLAGWQKAHGWDKNSTTAEVQAAFNAQTLELTWSAAGPMPECPRVDGVTHDFFDRPREGERMSPGPFGSVPREPTTVKLDPRRPK